MKKRIHAPKDESLNNEALQNLDEQRAADVEPTEQSVDVADMPAAQETLTEAAETAETPTTASPAQDASTEDAAPETESEKESFGERLKNFFVMLGGKIRNYFVGLGHRIRDFWVNAWHKTVRFFKNVGVFFKMLWTLCVEAKLKAAQKRARRRAEKAAETPEGTLPAEQTTIDEATVTATPKSVAVTADVATDNAEEQPVFADSEEDAEAEVDEVTLMRSRFAHFFRRRTKDEWKTALLGNNEKKGAIQLIVCYTLLILFGFVYIYPMLYMLAYSLMGESDVINPLVTYWPTEWKWSNYSEAAQAVNFFGTLARTAYISVLPALFQTAACCLTAYGLARFRFPGKKVLFGLIILTFIIPPQLTMFPQLVIFTNLHFSGNVLSFIVPAALGQGIKSAVFILIFYQFFRGIPDSVVEAAKIDGANSFQIFTRIGLPAAVPAILLSFLLSVVWYYNETVLTQVYIGQPDYTLPLQLQRFREAFNNAFGGGADSTTGKSVNDAIYMAGTLLNVLPLIIMFFFTQKYFVDGIDKAGITGE